MAFRTNAAPYQRARRSTLQIMIELSIALLLVWVAAVVYTFISAPKYGVKSILMMVVALATTAACDVVNTLLRHKKDSKTSLKDEILHDLVHNYSYVTAIIFTLTLPVWASYYVVIIGSIFATVVCKLLFGGFGKNIFNPAIMARIFVGICFNLSAKGLKIPTTDSTSGATITTIINGKPMSWLSDLPLDNLSMSDLFLGNYFGSLGETFTILILVLGVVLAIRKVINWRTPVFYLGTVVLTSLVIALVCGFRNPLTYVGYSVALGGLAFGAVFMLTDPVTGPTSNFGKSLIAVVAGLLTVLIRVKGGYPEGVMYSIAFCNLLSPAVDYISAGKTSAKMPVKYAAVFGLVAISVALCSGLAWNVNGGTEKYEINGITLSEYEKLTTTNNIDLKEGHQLSVENLTGQEVYSVVDASGNKVASIYYVEADQETWVDANGHMMPFTMKAYVAINLADDTVYDVGFVSGGTDKGYQGTVNGWVNKVVNGKLLQSILDIVIVPNLEEGAVLEIGASYSAIEVQKVVEKAYAIYAVDKGGK